MKKRSDFTFVELGIVAFLIIVLCFILSSIDLPGARERPARICCMGNLKTIGQALRMYADDNGGKLPNGPAKIGDGELGESDFYGRGRCGGFELLRGNQYLTDYGAYVCPVTAVCVGREGDSLSWSNEGSGSGKANLSYAYHAGMVREGSVETGMAGSAVSADLTGDAGVDSNNGVPNHVKYGNILFLDGHVKGFAGLGWFSPANAGYPDRAVGDHVVTPNTLRDHKTDGGPAAPRAVP